MARPRLPIGTAGNFRTVKEGLRCWRATCQFRDFDGEVRQIRRWAVTKVQAENRLREAVRDRQVAGGEISAESKMPEVVEKWLAEFREMVDLGTRSGTSYDTYCNRWTKLLLPRVRDFSINEMTAGRADRIVHDVNKSHSAATAKTCRAILSGACGLAIRHGAIKTNPIRDVRRVEQGRRRKKVSRALSVSEALKIFELFDADPVAVRQDLPDIARYFGGTGNRTGETLAIRWERIDFDAKIAYVDNNLVRIKGEGLKLNDGKSETAQRGIPLAGWLVEMLKDRRARVATQQGVDPEMLEGWVFPNSRGGLREANNLRRDWRAFRRRHKLGEWFTPYTFRRTVATLVTDELPTREASDLLGHSRISQTTDTYVGRKAVSRKAAEVLEILARAEEREFNVTKIDAIDPAAS
jgi:integrase